MRRLILLGMLMMWQLILTGGVFAATATFERRVWGRADGAPQAAYGFAQDVDGILWFPTVTGLYNFDGVHFNQVSSVYGHPLLSNNTIGVVAIGNAIAVSYQYGEVSVFARDAVRHYSSKDGLPPGAVNLTVDKTGGLYAATRTTGLAKLNANTGKWIGILDAEMQKRSIRWVEFDDAGTMWLATDAGLYAQRNAELSFRHVSAIRRDSYPSIIQGKLVAITGEGRLTQFSLDMPPVVFHIAADSGLKDSPFEGPDGTWWAWLNGGTTYLRAVNGVLQATQVFEGSNKLGNMVMRFLRDRENNLWVTTPEGIERYRLHRLHTLQFPSAALDLHIGRGLAEDMLVTSRDEAPVHRLVDGRFAPLPGLNGFSILYRQNADNVWLGGSAGLIRLTPSGISRWPLPDEIAAKLGVQGIVADKNGAILVSVLRDGLYRFLGGSWTKMVLRGANSNDIPICMLTGASGRTYLGYTQGRLAELTAGGISMVTTKLTESVGNILTMVEHEGTLLIGGERGVVWLRDGTAQSLQPQRMDAFLGVSGMATTTDGTLWMHGTGGLFRVPARDLTSVISGQSNKVDWEIFNFEDGLRGQVSQSRPLPSLSLGNDGNIYYATTSQIGWIDPTAIRRNPRAPTVLVTSIRTGQGSIAAKSGMIIAAGTTSLEIHFAATALSIPERVRFRYRLVGIDKDWQQPGLERAARYTNLSPGTYRFQVAAANEDGVWNNNGASLEFDIAPTIWQTYWFRAIAIALLLSLGLVLYRWRIATAARRSAEKTATRIEERERIARNLHDNLLQGVQALIMSCHAILMRMPAGTPEEKKLNAALDRADQMIEETRDEVMGLRGESTYLRLTERLQQSIAALEPVAGASVKLTLTGCIDQLDGRVAAEIFYVLQEAIANGIRHAGAGQILVAVDASEAGLHGSVIDDGCGMAPDIVDKGRAGHWGLTGMRERVSRLGGALTIDSQAGAGTSVVFSVPAQIALGAQGA